MLKRGNGKGEVNGKEDRFCEMRGEGRVRRWVVERGKGKTENTLKDDGFRNGRRANVKWQEGG